MRACFRYPILFRVLLLGVIALCAGLARAATFTVTHLGDVGAGSLRSAIASANAAAGADVIAFGASLTGTIGLTSGQLLINGDLTITGPGAGSLTVARTSGSFRIFDVTGAVTVSISGLTIANGVVAGADGGAVRAQGVTSLSLTSCALINCSADNGGGLYVTSGTATLTDCLISGCSVGGGLGGGIQNNESVLVMSGCTVTGCAAEGGGGVLALHNAAGSTLLTNCTLSGNQCDTFNPLNSGAGLLQSGTAGGSTLVNCTVTNNSVYSGTILHGAGVRNESGTLTLKNSIVAGNVVGAGRADISGTITSQGYNLIGDNLNGTITAMTGDQIGTPGAPINPMLGALASNGGPTQTHLPLVGSPAIDQGGLHAGLATDQRGRPRVVDFTSIADAAGGNASDIGAVEVDIPVLNVSMAPLSFGLELVGSYSFPLSIQFSGTYLIGDVVVTPPAGFEISTSLTGGYASTPLNFTPTVGALGPLDVFVRFAPSAAGAVNENISFATTEVATVNVAVTGTGAVFGTGGGGGDESSKCSTTQARSFWMLLPILAAVYCFRPRRRKGSLRV